MVKSTLVSDRQVNIYLPIIVQLHSFCNVLNVFVIGL